MYKTLLIPVDGRERSTRSLELGCRIAHMFDSHVVGLFVKPMSYIPSAVRAEGAEKMLQELQDKVSAQVAAEAKARFDAIVKPALMQRAEWRTGEGMRSDVVALHARYSDLIVINQTDPDAPDATHFGDAVLLAVGRPVLLVPYVGEMRSFGQNILVCWNASREASRAVTDALPLLQRAANVTVLTVDGHPTTYGHGESAGSDVALYLARHGVKTVASQTVSGTVDVGSVILSRAFDLSADLIVMGAYGHSRVREIVMGGATRTVLQSMTVPVLMSH